MAQARRIQGTISEDLWQAKEIIRSDNYYRNDGELIRALLRYAVAKRCPQTLSQRWASLSPSEQDILDKRLLASIHQPLPSTYLREEIFRVIQLLEKTTGKMPTVEQMMHALEESSARRSFY